MKQEAKKQHKKWIWLIAALAAVLVIAGVILAVFLTQGQQKDPAAGNAELYWNVDRALYSGDPELAGLSTREPADDGLYHIRFAINGEHIELSVADRQLINYIDSMNIMGLVFDADGVVIDALDPKTIAEEIGTDYYIQKVDGDTVTINSSVAMNGMEIELQLPSQDIIYDVTPDAEMIGAIAKPGSLSVMDKVTVYANDQEEVTHFYITERAPEAEVYWRVDRMYKSSQTTRVPDENGVYTILFAKDGQQVELKCRDAALVTKIDSQALLAGEVGLQFDEEGYIVNVVDAALALRGKKFISSYNVTAIDGNTITATQLISSSEKGKSVTFTMNDTCDMFMVCGGCYEGHIGERITELRLEDCFNLYTDMEGNPLLLHVTRRTVDSPMYFNLERKYDAVARTTSRVPDASGYYVFNMVCEGKQVTLRTKDKELARKVDVRSELCLGLKLNGDIIEAVYHPRCVAGGSFLALGEYVSAVTGSLFTTTYATDFTLVDTGVMSAKCKIYDVSGAYGVVPGTETDLRLYDTVTCSKNIYGEIDEIFVTGRYVEGTKIYYNLSRQYDAEKQQTRRTPDADGYYVFDMVCDGKQVTVKTKSKGMASYIDKQWAPLVAMKVSGGIAREAYPVTSAVKYGIKTANHNYVDKVNSDGTFTTYYYSGTERKQGATAKKLAKDCVIYNVSNVVKERVGEQTTLQEDDYIQAIAVNPDGECIMIFVRSRKVDSPLYWNLNALYDGKLKETTRQPNAEGYYVFDLAVDGKSKQYKTKDKAVATSVDAYGYSQEAFTMEVKGNVIIGAYAGTSAKSVKGKAASYCDVMSIQGSTVTVTRNQPNGTNYGKSYDLKLAKDCVFYDVSPYAQNRGSKSALGLGDRTVCYTNSEGEVSVCFITYKHTREKGHVDYCQHCGQEVFWNPYNSVFGTIIPESAHYYVTHDGAVPTQGTVTAKYDVVLDLNGHTMTTENRAFTVYGALTILDSVGGGGITAGNASGSYGGCFMVTKGGVLNLYDGAFTVAKTAGIPSRGGIVYLSSVGSTLNMHGGKIYGGTASDRGGNIIVHSGSIFNMTGGTVSGDTVLDAGSKISLSGSPVITGGDTTGLRLAAGVKITLGELTGKASVVVSANGIFTEETAKAAAYKTYFSPAKDNDTITVTDESNALYYTRFVPNFNKVDNSALVFDAGTAKAYCPACEEKVAWTALSGAAAIQLANGGHYYLAQDVTYEGAESPFITAPSGTACVHLNGHSITATAHRAIEGNAGILNIMGNGTVSGSYNENRLYGATVNMGSGKGGEINLIGGTYTKDTSCNVSSIILLRNGGDVNMYAGAEIVGVNDGKQLPNVRIYNHSFNMYGGKIFGGKGLQINTSGWNASATGLFTMRGGEIIGDIKINGADIKSGGCTISGGTINGTLTLELYTHSTISGGTINGSVVIGSAANNENASVTLAGSPVISGIILPEGYLLTLGELTNGADITVSTSGVFTQANESAQSYAAYFKPVNTNDRIEVQHNALACIKGEKDLNTINNADLVFDAGTTNAICPVCGKKVTWKAFTSTDTTLILLNNEHYYLADDLTYTGTDYFLRAPGTGGTACVHLNGHDLTATKARAFQGYPGVLNVMGNGTVSGNYTSSSLNLGATVAINTTGTNGAVNLIGGTYVAAENNPQKSVVSVDNNGGRINMYSGAKIDGSSKEYSVYVGNASRIDGSFHMYGGTITGGTVFLAGANTQNGHSCTFLMSGGTVQSGVIISANSEVCLSGAPVIEGAGLQIPEGVKITLGEMTQGAAVAVSASGVFTETNEKVADYVQYFQAADPCAQIILRDRALVCQGLVISSENNTALCPICGTEETWTAITAGGQTISEAGHYYLADSISYTGSNYGLLVSGGPACLYLNGKNLTATRVDAIRHTAGTLNVIGRGKVSGNSTNTANAHRAATLNIRGETAVMNLYGGTYGVSGTSSNAIANVNGYYGGTLNLYDGAVIGSADIATFAVRAYWGSFNMHGGRVIGGSVSAVSVAAWSGTKIGTFNMYDGEIVAGTGGAVDVSAGICNMSGGTVDGAVEVAASSAITVSGSPLITDLKLAQGVTLTLGQMWDGADIRVFADGAFTAANDKAADYAKYFTAADTSCSIVVKDNILYCEKSTSEAA